MDHIDYSGTHCWNMRFLFVWPIRGNKKVRARYRKIDQQLFAYLNQDEQIIEELSKKDERLANDFKYLWKCASSPVYKNTDVKYYGDTCDAMAAQLEDMMQAKKFIFLEYHAIEMAESFSGIAQGFDGKGKRRRRNSYFV